MSYEEAIKEAYASAPTNIVILHTITVSHPAFSVPIRVVRDNRQHHLDAVDYQPFSFDFKLADISDDGVSEIIITMDNVSGDIEANIELAVGSSDHITVTYRPYLFDLDTGTQPVGATGCQMNPPLAMKVKSINANVFQISMRASFNDIVNRPFPPNVYTVEKFPGLVT
jgi:hypothetical protein